jgi:hypothetical protein
MTVADSRVEADGRGRLLRAQGAIEVVTNQRGSENGVLWRTSDRYLLGRTLDPSSSALLDIAVTMSARVIAPVVPVWRRNVLSDRRGNDVMVLPKRPPVKIGFVNANKRPSAIPTIQTGAELAVERVNAFDDGINGHLGPS